MPLFQIAAQLAAAPFYPGYSFSRQSASMLGTQISRQPWIFNTGEILSGLAAFAAALGLYRSVRRLSSLLLSALIGLSIAGTGIMTLKAGLFPMPDPRHNSWGILYNLTVAIPFLLLLGLWKGTRNAALRAYLLFSPAFLLALVPLIPRLGPGALQRLIAVGTVVPVGVIGFYFWREG